MLSGENPDRRSTGHSAPQRQDQSTRQVLNLQHICERAHLRKWGRCNSDLVTEEEAFPTWVPCAGTHTPAAQGRVALKQLGSDRHDATVPPRLPPHQNVTKLSSLSTPNAVSIALRTPNIYCLHSVGPRHTHVHSSY